MKCLLNVKFTFLRFQSEAATWSTAESMCEEQGAHLVAIHSEAENAAVEILSEGSDMWIGLKKGVRAQGETSKFPTVG